MKSLQFIASFIFLFVFSLSTYAQTKSASFKVWGNCGMCKKTIEGAAKNNGASYANWNVDTKMMTVNYASTETSVDKIQKGIADAGYDNVNYTGSDEAYNELHECCKYDRKNAATGDAKACCMKDGKCTGNKECCKKMDGKTDCCANGTCVKEGGCCAGMKCEKGNDCCKKHGMGEAKACCMKDGKCTGDKECCKKMDGKTDCCANGTCAKEGGCCAGMKCEKGGDHSKKEAADCCKGKEGKCAHH